MRLIRVFDAIVITT